MVKTRAEEQQICLKLYGQIGLDSTESSYLINKGMRTPSAIINALITSRIDSLISENFHIGAASQFEMLAKYLIWYRDQHGSLQGISKNFSKEAFEIVDPNKISIPSSEKPKKIDKNQASSDYFKLKSVIIPSFPVNGRIGINYTRKLLRNQDS